MGWTALTFWTLIILLFFGGWPATIFAIVVLMFFLKE